MQTKRLVTGIFLGLLLFVPDLMAAERLAVNVNNANVRSGPGTQYDIIWRVEKYYPVEVISRRDDWVFFRDFEGDEGWIHASLLEKIDTVITKKEKCNVRQGPSTQKDIVFKVDEAVPFKVIDRKGNWIQIQHADGDQGWIYSTLVW